MGPEDNKEMPTEVQASMGGAPEVSEETPGTEEMMTDPEMEEVEKEEMEHDMTNGHYFKRGDTVVVKDLEFIVKEVTGLGLELVRKEFK